MLHRPRTIGLLMSLLGPGCINHPESSGSSTGAASSTTGGPGDDASAASTASTASESSAADGSDAESASAASTSALSSTSDTSQTASTAVEAPICGDGVLDPGEECDLSFVGNKPESSCLPNCVKATCGDGYVQDGVEECDDQNGVPTDGCHQCGRTRRVFVTSELYQGKQFMDLWGADQRCRSLAAQAGLANFAGYKAWLSDSKTAARDRMYAGRGRYELVNGLLVAESWEALLQGELKHPINVTQTSETRAVTVWTGTNPDGTRAEGADFCLDWTATVKHYAHWGVSSETSPSWTMAATHTNPTDCTGALALYCFEQQ